MTTFALRAMRSCKQSDPTKGHTTHRTHTKERLINMPPYLTRALSSLIVCIVLLSFVLCRCASGAARDRDRIRFEEDSSCNWRSKFVSISPAAPIINIPNEYDWLLITRIHEASHTLLPLADVTILLTGRLQVCRPNQVRLESMMPPSIRGGTPPHHHNNIADTIDLHNECIIFWHSNIFTSTNSVGVVSLHLSVPRVIFDSHPHPTNHEAAPLLTRRIIHATNKRLQHDIRHECHPWRPSDRIWMDMFRFGSLDSFDEEEAAKGRSAAAAREWSPQGIATIDVNLPELPGYRLELETRQLLWPFDPAISVHETNLILLPRDPSSIVPPVHPHPKPFMSQPTLLPPSPSFLKDHTTSNTPYDIMTQWWSVLWIIPFSAAGAIIMLEINALVCQPESRQHAASWLDDAGRIASLCLWVIVTCFEPVFRHMIEFVGYLLNIMELHSEFEVWWNRLRSVGIKAGESISEALSNIGIQLIEWINYIGREVVTLFISLRPMLGVIRPTCERLSRDLFQQFLIPIIDLVLPCVPTSLQHSFVWFDDTLARWCDQLWKRWSNSLARMIRKLLPPSRDTTPTHAAATTEEAEPAASQPSCSADDVRQIEVGRGSPYLREDARLLDQQSGLKRFHQLIEENAPPTSTREGDMPPTPTPSSDAPFESSVWSKMERQRRATHRERLKQQRQQREVMHQVGLAARDAYDHPLSPEAGKDPSSTQQLVMPIWREEEIKFEQRKSIQPVAYAVATTSSRAELQAAQPSRHTSAAPTHQT